MKGLYFLLNMANRKPENVPIYCTSKREYSSLSSKIDVELLENYELFSKSNMVKLHL